MNKIMKFYIDEHKISVGKDCRICLPSKIVRTFYERENSDQDSLHGSIEWESEKERFKLLRLYEIPQDDSRVFTLSNGRINLTKKVIDELKLIDKVAVVGMQDFIDIINPKDWDSVKFKVPEEFAEIYGTNRTSQ